MELWKSPGGVFVGAARPPEDLEPLLKVLEASKAVCRSLLEAKRPPKGGPLAFKMEPNRPLAKNVAKFAESSISIFSIVFDGLGCPGESPRRPEGL